MARRTFPYGTGVSSRFGSRAGQYGAKKEARTAASRVLRANEDVLVVDSSNPGIEITLPSIGSAVANHPYVIVNDGPESIEVKQSPNDPANSIAHLQETLDVEAYNVATFSVANGAWWLTALAQLSAETFLELGDTPTSYSGQAGKVVTVAPGEDELIFADAGGGGPIGYENLLTGRTLVVGKRADDQYQTIEAALGAAVALSPTQVAPVVIRVRPGTYTENTGLVIPDNVWLMSYASMLGDHFFRFQDEPQPVTVYGGFRVLTKSAGPTGIKGMRLRQVDVNTPALEIVDPFFGHPILIEDCHFENAAGAVAPVVDYSRGEATFTRCTFIQRNSAHTVFLIGFDTFFNLRDCYFGGLTFASAPALDVDGGGGDIEGGQMASYRCRNSAGVRVFKTGLLGARFFPESGCFVTHNACEGGGTSTLNVVTPTVGSLNPCAVGWFACTTQYPFLSPNGPAGALNPDYVRILRDPAMPFITSLRAPFSGPTFDDNNANGWVNGCVWIWKDPSLNLPNTAPPYPAYICVNDGVSFQPKWTQFA
jgi:hypothetical protein